jgi:hypothetical protein
MLPAEKAAHVSGVLLTLEQFLRVPASEQGIIDMHTVEAIDVINHALAFVRHPGGLEHWRRALWRSELTAESRAAVEAMMNELIDAQERNDMRTVTAICDCLHTFLPPATSLSQSLVAPAISGATARPA